MVAPVGRLSTKETKTPIQTERMATDRRDTQGAPEAPGHLKRGDRREYEEGRGEHDPHELHCEHHGYGRQHREERVDPRGVDARDRANSSSKDMESIWLYCDADDTQDDQRERHRHHDLPYRDGEYVPEEIAEQIDIEARADAREQHAAGHAHGRDYAYGGIAVQPGPFRELEDRERAESDNRYGHIDRLHSEKQPQGHAAEGDVGESVADQGKSSQHEEHPEARTKERHEGAGYAGARDDGRWTMDDRSYAHSDAKKLNHPEGTLRPSSVVHRFHSCL